MGDMEEAHTVTVSPSKNLKMQLMVRIFLLVSLVVLNLFLACLAVFRKAL